MHFTGQVYRHPIEGNTSLLEVTAGCSHNKCTFCAMYKNTPFAVSPLEHVEEDLQELKSTGIPVKRIFLVNGEAFVLSSDKLIEIGEKINEYFPEIETITCYASIKNLKNKGFTQEEAYENLEKLTTAGIEWDAIVMIGVAGKGNGEIHIEETAKLINTFSPYMVSIMTTSVTKGSELEAIRDKGEFVECTELEKLEEEKKLLRLLELKDCYLFGSHNYNLIPVSGEFKHKQDIIDYIDRKINELDDAVLNSLLQRAAI